jgi:small subunit ribosomal protein S2
MSLTQAEVLTERENTVSVISMKQLLEAGVHFGHRTRRWHPKMRTFIFTERNGIHIIDLQQTMRQVNNAYTVVRDAVREGGLVLFVGTKKQAQETVKSEAERCGMPYITTRWLGGTLTNFRTIRQRVEYMQDLERRQSHGDLDRLPKKEALLLRQELARLNNRIGGLRNMTHLPDMIFIVDVMREELAVIESNKLHIPIVAMVDTNCDPDPINYPIPSNDDAIRAIKLMAGKMADAVVEGMQMREIDQADRAATQAEAVSGEPVDELAQEKLDRAPRMEFDDFSAEEEGAAEDYLGPSVLEKLAQGLDAELPPAAPDAELPPAAPDAELPPATADAERADATVGDDVIAGETVDNA